MGAFPKELVTVGAFEKLVEPFIGARWDAIADLFLIDFDEFAAAAHAAGFKRGFGKVEFGADVTELLQRSKRGRNPQRADFAANDRAAVEKEAVGGEKDSTELLGFADKLGV